MNEDQEKAYRNLYDAVTELFDNWDNIEDIYLSDFIAIRKAKCESLEKKIDQLDDELYNQYLELEYFENKKKDQIQTRLDV